MNFSEYLKQIRLEKSISQRELAEKSGISNAEISRIESGARQKPSPDALKALAPILGVEYEDLMDKAGYLSGKSYAGERTEAHEKFIDILTPHLIKNGWNVELCSRRPSIGDIMAKKGDIVWFIDFKYFRTRDDNERNFRDDMMAKDLSWRTYGRLATYDDGPIAKFTIAINNTNAYNTLLRFPPRHLNLSISIMLIDFESHRIVAEQQLT